MVVGCPRAQSHAWMVARSRPGPQADSGGRSGIRPARLGRRPYAALTFRPARPADAP
jgi:hypothetical protein